MARKKSGNPSKKALKLDLKVDEQNKAAKKKKAKKVEKVNTLDL